MKLTQTLSILAFIYTLLIIKQCKMVVYNKLTNAVCESLNKSWIVFDTCRLRAISREKTTLNIRVTLLHPVNNVHIRLELKKKANGYKPWLWDYTIDGCAFMRQRSHPVFKMFYDIFKDYSSLNHTCPYAGKQFLKDFYYDPKNLTLPVPTGEYLLLLTWIVDKKPQVVTKVYYHFQQDIFRE